jgi:DNA-binding transcriptional LysR family regulator
VSLPLPALEALECFVAAAEAGQFRSAARRVALSPNAFSQRIRQAEDQLGVTLFERTTRKVKLTTAGASLLPVARQALDAVREVAEVAREGRPATARIRLGTRFELGISWLVPAMVALRTSHPHWQVQLVFGSGDEILAALREHRVDALVTSAPVALDAWSVEPLHPETYAYVASPCCPAEHRDVLVDLDASLPLARYLFAVAPALVFREHVLCGTIEAARRLVLAGVGIGVLPEYLVSEDLAQDTLVRLPTSAPLLSDTFRLQFHTRSTLAPVLRALADVLRGRPLR